MKFKNVDEREFAMLMAAQKYRRTGIQKILDEFMLSTEKVVELDWPESYSCAKSCAGSFQAAIKRAHIACEVLNIKGRVFLRKKEL